MVLLVAGTGSAIAIGEGGSHGGPGGGASTAQYKPGKGCGDKNHQHKGSGSCPKPKKTSKSDVKAIKAHRGRKKSTTKAKSKKGGTPFAKCTIHTQHGLTVLYCP